MADTRTHRPDLEAVEYKRPDYITDSVFPLLPRAMRQGTLYYQDLQADVAAQTARVTGAAPTLNLIADEKTTYDLEGTERIHRGQIPDDEIAGLGGLGPAQQVATRRGKRAVGEGIEQLTSAAILANGSVTYTAVGTSFIGAVHLGYDTLADLAAGYGGEIALVLSSRLFSLVRRYEEVVERMKFTGVVARDVNDVRGVSAFQLAGAIGVERILVGNNTAWYTPSGTYHERAALVVLPDKSVDPNEVPQVGRTLWFSATGEVPSEEKLFECHSWYSENLLSEVVDVRAYAQQKQLNLEFVYGLSGIDATLLPS